jgi:hypothetical protein
LLPLTLTLISHTHWWRNLGGGTGWMQDGAAQTALPTHVHTFAGVLEVIRCCVATQRHAHRLDILQEGN